MTTKFFELYFEPIFRDMVAIWEDKTGLVLERQDAERILIQIFSGAIYDWGRSFLAAANHCWIGRY